MQAFASESEFDTIEEVWDAYRSAAEVIPVEGGWRVFEFADDAETWRNQQ